MDPTHARRMNFLRRNVKTRSPRESGPARRLGFAVHNVTDTGGAVRYSFKKPQITRFLMTSTLCLEIADAARLFPNADFERFLWR